MASKFTKALSTSIHYQTHCLTVSGMHRDPDGRSPASDTFPMNEDGRRNIGTVVKPKFPTLERKVR